MTFSEAIKIKDGVFYNLAGHLARMNRTAMHFFGHGVDLDLSPRMIPPDLRTGLVKCRVVYGLHGVDSVEFSPYVLRTIKSVATVHDDTIEYAHKSTDRSRIDALVRASGADEIIIVKDGSVTDSSFANLVLEDSAGALVTPSTCLLPGTKRAQLLERGIIVEREVREHNLRDATKIYLINAMIDLEDGVTLPVINKSV